MQGLRGYQIELGDLNRKTVALFIGKVVETSHAAMSCIEGAGRFVLEGLSRLNVGLKPYHTRATDFFFIALRVAYSPMAAHQLGGDISRVGDGNFIGEEVVVFFWSGLFVDIRDFGRNFKICDEHLLYCHSEM